MDAFALLLAVLAVGVYPGGVFLAALSWAVIRVARLGGGPRLDAAAGAAIVAAGLAASMAQLPGSPTDALPPPGGASPNLAGALLLLFVAGALVTRPPWSRRRIAVLIVAIVPPLLLACAAASLSIRAIAALPGGELGAARALTAAGLLVAAPLVIQPHTASVHVAARAALLAASTEVALSMLVPRILGGWPAYLAVGCVAAAVVAHSGLVRLVRGIAAREHGALLTLVTGCAAAASVLALLATRS